MAHPPTNLNQLKEEMRRVGVRQLYFKRLSDNDNSKNQIYLGPDFSALNILPAGELEEDRKNPNILKAPLNFSWLSDGILSRAPHAQLILYPQYPEVRFSGFLLGCQDPPSKLMTVRRAGRLLFFGVRDDGQVIGYVVWPDSALSLEIEKLNLQPDSGVFSSIPLDFRTDDRGLLLRELRRIARLGWIDSKRLNSQGELVGCNSPNCGGYTLEAELGVRPNGLSDPDFHGWEIKQHNVVQLSRPDSGGPITLMTPEPTGGIYIEKGIREFIRRFGYADRQIPDRRNFGGIHSALKICAKTDLRLTLDSYDGRNCKITDLSSGISLVNEKGEAAATWHYKDLLKHWMKKHARAAYVPSIKRISKGIQYQYGGSVRLAEGTDFLLFVNAMAKGAVYYDPGIKIENYSQGRSVVKKRSQFRIKSANIKLLYSTVEEVCVKS
jgi:MvaI/BcnI restriction endonuclease family